jgi:uncharacterized protein YcbK (DUF882 family)
MDYRVVTHWTQQAAMALTLSRRVDAADPTMVSEHFRLAEFRCKCGCGRVFLVPQLVEIVEHIRVATGLPLVVNSGYRCPQHNEEMAGTAEQSKHCVGCAADLGIPPNLQNANIMIEAAQIAVSTVHGGYHFYPSGQFIHVDCWPWPADRRW